MRTEPITHPSAWHGDMLERDRSFEHHLPTIGWTSGDKLDTAITDALNGIADVEKQSADGTYAVPGPGGWPDRNAATAALALPDCRPQGPSPCLSPDDRPRYQDVLRRIPIAVAADLAVRQRRLALLEAFQAAIGGHIRPRVEQLSMELEQWAGTQGEFAIELDLIRQQHDDRVAYLRSVIDGQIP